MSMSDSSEQTEYRSNSGWFLRKPLFGWQFLTSEKSRQYAVSAWVCTAAERRGRRQRERSGRRKWTTRRNEETESFPKEFSVAPLLRVIRYLRPLRCRSLRDLRDLR